MACEPISSILSFSDLLVWPTTCAYYFYLIILGGVFTIIAWAIFKEEERKRGSGELISALGITSIAIVSLAGVGTLIKNNAGIPMIQTGIMLYILAFSIVFILIWIFKD